MGKVSTKLTIEVKTIRIINSCFFSMESKGVSFFATFLVFFYGESKSGFFATFFFKFSCFPLWGEWLEEPREVIRCRVEVTAEQTTGDLLFLYK